MILDVVYNHLGPDGNYLARSSPATTSPTATRTSGARRSTSTAPTPARSASSSSPTPATGSTSSTSTACASTPRSRSSTTRPTHILAEIGRRVREAARGRATIIIVAENEPQDTRLVRPVEQGGYGLDALWNDDFHHSAMVALTGRNEAYYTDYRGTPQEFISRGQVRLPVPGPVLRLAEEAARHAGARPAAGRVRHLPPEPRPGRQLRPAACACHQLTSPGRYRAMTALLLLAPGTPMLFQGQEFAASAPFLYFADHDPELAALVTRRAGGVPAPVPEHRRSSTATADAAAGLADPGSLDTFERCKLDFVGARAPRRRLRAAPRPAAAPPRGPGVRGRTRTAASTARCSARRRSCFASSATMASDGDDRLLLVNLGRDLNAPIVPEPLLAPPEDASGRRRSRARTRATAAAGPGQWRRTRGWHVPGHAAVVLRPRPAPQSLNGHQADHAARITPMTTCSRYGLA